MKVEEVPQDRKYLDTTMVRDVNYAIDANGQYQKVLSDGWAPKNDALEVTWDAIDDECQEILERIKEEKSSPLEYYCVKNLMDVDLLSDYTGIPKRKIRKHFEPKYFNELPNDVLETYAEALRITVEELKKIPEAH